MVLWVFLMATHYPTGLHNRTDLSNVSRTSEKPINSFASRKKCMLSYSAYAWYVTGLNYGDVLIEVAACILRHL